MTEKYVTCYTKKNRKKYNSMKRNKKVVVIVISLILALLTGCGEKPTRIVLHTGFAKNEVFRIEQMSCSLPELMVYLTTTQSRYEKVYGEEIWETSLEGVTLEENIKEMVLAQLSQVKAMNLLAQQENIELNKEEEEKVAQAATKFYNTLSKEEIRLLDVDKDLIRRLYKEYAIANKVYYFLIKDINPEVSDDEARTITVEHILIKTYLLDENNQKVDFSGQQKEEAFLKAQEVLQKARNGASFDSLISAYNEDKQSQYSFRKGEMNQEFETAAFNLGKGEISEIVETEYGYHIIKCITTFNQEETDANKIKIVEKKRDEAFGQRYSEFASQLTKAVNEELWGKVTLIKDTEIDTSEFFYIYREYLDEAFRTGWD